jgi:putative FmdB family regulatory protein
MPAYDYQCETCGHEFEVSHGMDAPGPAKCPECGKRKVKRQFKRAPAYQARYSPMHPRANRGRGH